jgi:hypothetical protein
VPVTLLSVASLIPKDVYVFDPTGREEFASRGLLVRATFFSHFAIYIQIKIWTVKYIKLDLAACVFSVL